MLNTQVAVKYAEALFELAKADNSIVDAQQQLTQVMETIEQHADLRYLLFHPLIAADVKKGTMIKVFGDDLHRTVKNFFMLVIDKRREAALPAIVREYVTLANEFRNIVVADVTTAFPLTDAQAKALANKLGIVAKKNIVIRQHIDASIIGGVIVKIGDKLIDGSVARQLCMLQTALTKIPLTKIGVTG